ncbi:MAG: putative transport system ATP-binding protein [Archaeoglobi archaeon]|nr:ABC transporter ATP-binding protein [Candidatus Mnemosynella bozhongmuii]MDI3502039.1 putative transport system ATP-binding protein [Archaeoglobi archaeon]MDK2781297.1 putative transport system ATP-binding protein [Archaeoglobi archaeon]
MSSDALIELRDVHKFYELGKVRLHVLKGINLKIHSGEFTSIMGPSGSGKSTLMHLMGCLDRPSSGDVIISGVRTKELGDRELSRIRRETVGFVFQSFNLIPRFSALKNVELPMIFSGVPREERIRRAAELLERVGLSERIHHKPAEMSGGEQQRVAIARALVNNPRIILADEPTGNLDTATGEEIMKLFEEMNREGLTIVIVTHDPEIAERTKRIIRIRDGVIEREERR